MPVTITLQFMRYAVVGLISNVSLYLAYLLLTSHGLGHKTTMSLLYVVGITQTFHFNRRWSFQHDSVSGRLFARYAGLYLLAWIFNWAALAYLVDALGLPHQWVQGVLILLIAGVLFLAQRTWIFKSVAGFQSVPSAVRDLTR